MNFNPFTPTFGTSPSHPVGREEIIADFRTSLHQGPGAPSRAMLLVGTRGVGKTVLLNELEDTAREEGWLVVSETALPGLTTRLNDEHLPALLASLDPHPTTRRITGITAPAGLGGIRSEVSPKHEPKRGIRGQLTTAAGLVNHGILITVDEIGRATVEELAELMAVIQHLFRERANVAIAAAGLPEEVAALLDHPGITFLRRANRRILGAVRREDAERGLADPVTTAGAHWEDSALRAAVEATHGYPFLIQLIGYHAWNAAGGVSDGDAVAIDGAAAGNAIERAAVELGNLVIEPTLARCTALERAFLEAMALDDGDSRLADLITRLEKSPDTVSQYRRRLLDRYIIVATGHGLVRFAIPGMREYLRRSSEHGPLPFW
ncbi:ATP-binding protein [Corynebacterium epidermidicanis]|uniref:AAA ATPase domain n=1 Tax=Corynebacterium epidermidicanis TaxID=1050174 RepID=A0A0G3GS79_9CORY|nr:ATP-binding protein [Corynebacterium epidermidicanis]AKK03430.1 AAA ATPase domain [Corynebacterium epidermidicanis]